MLLPGTSGRQRCRSGLHGCSSRPVAGRLRGTAAAWPAPERALAAAQAGPQSSARLSQPPAAARLHPGHHGLQERAKKTHLFRKILALTTFTLLNAHRWPDRSPICMLHMRGWDVHSAALNLLLSSGSCQEEYFHLPTSAGRRIGPETSVPVGLEEARQGVPGRLATICGRCAASAVASADAASKSTAPALSANACVLAQQQELFLVPASLSWRALW